MDASKDCKSMYRRFFYRSLPTLSQIFFVLVVWEFLRWSIKPATEETVNPRRWRSANHLDCFHNYTQSYSLRLDSIMSRAGAASERNAKDIVLVLDVDIIVRSLGSGSLIVYPAGTTVFVRAGDFARDEQVWNMGYFEYNDDEIPSSIINVDFFNKEQGQDGVRERGNGFVQKGETEDKIKADYVSNGTDATQKTVNAKPTESRALDVMLVEDEMLKVRPKDQFQQQEIMRDINNKKADRFLLRKRTLLIKTEYIQTSKSRSWVEKDSNTPENHQNNSEVQLKEDTRDKIQQNLAKDDPLAWPDVVLDEASEPLYTEGFLERVQKAKSELYAQPRLYDQTLKKKVRKYYLLNNARACAGVQKVDIVYLIHSQPHSQQQRQLIRDTIVKPSLFRPFHIVYIFLLGKTRILQIQEDLRHESKLYGDIVQGDFDDKVANNVWKSLMGMRWVLQYCSNMNFVLKINEGVFVDTDKLLRGLIPASTNIIAKRAVFCSLRLDQSNTTNSFNLTQPYCDGFAILMTRHLVCSIVAASHQIRVPSVEDYYLYGVLPFVIGGVQVYNVSGKLGFQKDEVRSLSCFQEQVDRCSVVATQSQVGRFMDLWDLIASRHWKPEGWSGLWDLQTGKNYFS